MFRSCYFIPVILLVFPLMIISGCKKNDDREKPEAGLQGDFDYQYSYSDYGSEDFSTAGKKGIRIKKNGNVFFFDEGRQSAKGYLSTGILKSGNVEYSGTVIKIEEYEFECALTSQDFLVVKGFPAANMDNYFKKIK